MARRRSKKEKEKKTQRELYVSDWLERLSILTRVVDEKDRDYDSLRRHRDFESQRAGIENVLVRVFAECGRCSFQFILIEEDAARVYAAKRCPNCGSLVTDED
ncbi:MAG: hypothetical protein HY460_02360 [Parcubacteria group bacterium]|nr:hypothetical protein [Parcubacteria group bacterium]